MTQQPLDPRALGRIRWRCRRGLLENDLLLERFLRRHAGTLTREQASALEALLALPEPSLLDLLLGRAEPDASLDRPSVHALLALLRSPATPEARP